jgi:phosphoribosyl-AMP cyclohydrolase
MSSLSPEVLSLLKEGVELIPVIAQDSVTGEVLMLVIQWRWQLSTMPKVQMN